MPKLKVFRTPIGFDDAYVAATSRKAALQAWGADADLFARGLAEQVDDPALTPAALANPGIVIRVTRGSAEEHLRALQAEPPATGRRTKPPAQAEDRPEDAGRARRRVPQRPSRAALDKAEKAVADHDAEHRRVLAELREQEQAIATARRRADARDQRDRPRLDRAVERARAEWQAAMAAWREAAD